MKRREVKEMIKAAFLAEMGSDAQYADEKAYGFYNEAEVEEDLDEMLARLSEEEIEEGDKVVDLYLAEAEDEEETDIDVDADIDVEKEDDGEEEKSTNDSIVIDKKIVSLSSLPGETRKILDTLETLRAQAEEFGDQKFITQVGNTITFFTRDFVVAGDQPTMAKVDEDYNPAKDKIKLTPGEIAVVNDLTESINEGSIDLSKVKNYAKKGLMTLGVIATLLGGANLTLQQKQDVVDTVKTEVRDQRRSQELQWMGDAALAHSLYSNPRDKERIDKLAETNLDVKYLISHPDFQNYDKLDAQDIVYIGKTNQDAIKAIRAEYKLQETLNESLTFPLWNKIK